MDLDKIKVAVVGLSSRTGVAVVEALASRGADILVSDIKKRSQLEKQLKQLQHYDFKCDLGGHTRQLLDCDLLVVSPGVPLNIPVIKQAIAEEIPVISEVELAYNLTEAQIVGITGTNGKTTTTELVGDIFKEGVETKVRVAGNIGVPLISVIDDLNTDDWIIAELSSFQLEAVKNFRPQIGLFLNFTPDHLDRHHSQADYWQAKANLFSNQKSSDYAVVNKDQPEVVAAVRQSLSNIYGISLEKELPRGVFLQGDQLVARTPEYSGKVIDRVDIPLLGNHNIYNVCFAIQTALLAGINLTTIKKVITKFEAAAHRLEMVITTEKNITIIDDSKATNPAAAAEAIKAIEKPLVLIAGGQDRRADFSKLAKLIVKRVKKVIFMGETAEKLTEAVLQAGFDKNNLEIVKNMENAVQAACNSAETGDCILLSPGCPSWDMYSSYRQRGKEFNRNIKKYFNGSVS